MEHPHLFDVTIGEELNHIFKREELISHFSPRVRNRFGESLRARSGEIYAEVEQRSRRSYTFAPRAEKWREGEERVKHSSHGCFARYCPRHFEYLRLRVISACFKRYLLYHYNCNEILRNVTDCARVRSRLLHNGGNRPLIASRDWNAEL